MDPLCDFCGAQRPMVYCRSDTARLCLSCDSYIHSANALSRRHLRSVICDICNSQPAIVRCLEDKVSLCQSCDCRGSAGVGPGHRQETVNCYSGCPSSADLSRFWSCGLDAPTVSEVDGSWGSGLMTTINENCVSNGWEQGEDGSSVGLSMELNDLGCCGKLEPWMDSSSMVPNLNYMPCCGDQQTFQKDPNQSKLGCSPFTDLGICDGDDICEGFNIDDVAVCFGNSDETFGCSQSHSRDLIEDTGTDCLFMENFLVADCYSPIENAIEASSWGQHDCMAHQSSHVVGPAGMVQAASSNTDRVLLNPYCNRNISPGFPAKHSRMSLLASNLTSENGAVDYQDGGESLIFLTGKSPWASNLETTCPQARHKAKIRYNEKKKTRMFGKQIRYASRKARADTRKRVKGRFVKAGEAYDYDPLVGRTC
ncbi:putative zinc finger protein CONSTANS-LIKE 11 [Magnolia sinica]|uniref:putative zinc finger protein CONSTANS-LIKE 11 n=1 Tax=Magnolia sinica TaxID=86752 RepID=UPI002658982A|nr:putative zinc finger protein CONSTANS-LIKE 11 [Magnolia sinica]